MANNKRALGEVARVKQAIMLYGGVVTALAKLPSFEDLNATSYLYDVEIPEEDKCAVELHAVFCYGWSDATDDMGGGWWLCKNR
jgi:hypothetical protein